MAYAVIVGIVTMSFPKVLAAKDLGAWQIEENSGHVRFTTQGTKVHGHLFGFVLSPGKCDVRETWLTWSTSHPQIENQVGTNVELSFIIGRSKFKVAGNIDMARELFTGSGLFVILFAGISATPELVALLDQNRTVTIAIGNPASKIFDVQRDEFRLDGFMEARLEAQTMCRTW